MKKSNFLLVLILLCFTSIVSAQNPAKVLASVFDPNQKNVLVAAHRADWRNAPENSIKALQFSIEKGFDIAEIDVKMSKDGHLVVMHDDKIDRTTNGKGKVADFTLAELKAFKLRNGQGRVTHHQIPTFLELMQVAKDKIVINVDKSDNYLPAVFEVLKQTETINQAIVNFSENEIYNKLKNDNQLPKDICLMAVVNMKNPNALATIEKYRLNQQIIIQPIFDTDTLASLNELPEISSHQAIWLNSLWPSLNGGHDDDMAVEDNKPQESWGWLINKRAKIIQTDRPLELLEYLRKNKLHN